MSEHHGPESTLEYILGEMRADLNYLVSERRKQTDRLAALEVVVAAEQQKIEDRLTGLEKMKTKIGVFTASLGVLVPTALGVAAHKMGLM